MKTLNDFDFNEKTVLLRVDINSSVADGRVQEGPRYAEAGEAVKALVKKNAKVVVLAHQGRAGGKDFLPLQQHAEILSKHSKRKVKYVDDLFGSTALTAIKKLRPGKVLLLENTRFYAEETLKASPEELSKTVFVKTLASAADAFVNNAFSVCHRAQASVVGFPQLLPSFAGPSLEKEVKALSKITGDVSRPCVYCLGGAKVEECIALTQAALAKGSVDKVLTSGVLGELFLLAEGKDLGLKKDWLEEKGFTQHVPTLKKLLDEHGPKIVMPTDFAFKDNEGFRVEVPLSQTSSGTVFDIGVETANRYAGAIKQAKTVLFKGPCGRFEEKQFELGTQKILEAVSKSKAFSLVGGGDSTTALKALGFSHKKFSHVCTAGGAMLAFLGGQELPGLKALEKTGEKD